MSKAWHVGAVDYFRNRGRGGHGTHLAFAGLPGVEICAVADPDGPSRSSLKEETGAKQDYADWRELLEKEQPDILCVCSRLPTRHLDVVTAAAQAGCHIYCEKPLAATLEEADLMVAGADAAGVLLAVAHLGRYAAVFRTMRDMIRRGDIGRPLAVHCRGKEDERGGGEDMLVLGTHLLDLARFFFGDPQWVFGHVSVQGRDMLPEDVQEPTEPVGKVAGDEVVALYGFDDGVRGHFESRRGQHRSGETRMGITVVGEEAALQVRYDAERRLRIRRSNCPLELGGDFEEVPVPPLPELPGAVPLEVTHPGAVGSKAFFARANRQAALDLLAAVEEGREPISSGRDARWALEMVHGIYASHLQRRAMLLPLQDRRPPLEKPN